MRPKRRLLLAALLTTGCAAAEPLGVRDAWRGQPVKQVALVEPYTISPFGLDSAAHTALIDATRSAATAELARRGVEVISPAVLSHTLIERGLWQTFEDGVGYERALRERFELTPDTSAPIEVTTLRALAAQGALPAPLLFIEVAYHTEGTCHTVPDEGDTVTLAPEGGRATPTPCITTHLYGKLIEPSSAQPLWYNHMLREHHASAFQADDQTRNIVQAVTLLLSGEHGLTRLLGR